MAREVAEVKGAQQELPRLLLSRKSVSAVSYNTEEIRHPVFQKQLAFSLKSVKDFNHSKEELLKNDVKINFFSNTF